MKQLSTELLKMKHTRLVAEMAMYTAIANRETSMGGWRCGWDEVMEEAATNAAAIELELVERERRRK